jgi:ribulose-5-phosphate 4-epimerase/fuculose-1-phosphate aldolase
VELPELSSISAYIGNLRNLVQGPGGNTSIKLDGNLYVKASGTRLAEALARDIFCRIDINTGEVLTETLRPSIELGLHLHIDAPVVLHVHSIGSLAWALRARTETENQFLDELNLIRAPYLRPGDQITKYLTGLEGITNHEGILLQNHGLITWGKSSGEALQRLLRIESELHIKGILSISPNKPHHNLNELFQGVALTPDHAVFSDVAPIAGNSTNSDVSWALDQALKLIPKTSEITTISPEEVNYLRNWEAEKYRKSMNQ